MSTHIDSVRLFLKQRKYSHRTAESYVHWTQRLQDHFPHQEISTLSREDITSFFQHLHTRRLSDQSVRQAASAIRFLLKEIFRNKELADAIPKIRIRRPEAKIPTQHEVIRILDAIEHPVRRAALKCIYGMGLELQEALSMKIRDIDFVSHRARVIPQRSKTIRLVPIPLFAVEEIKTVISARSDNDFVFTSKDGGRCGEQSLQRALRAARKKVGITTPYSIRSLRHAYIRHLELLGVPLKDVLHHLGVNKARALEFYSLYGAPISDITFSPADRVLYEGEEATSLDTQPYVSEDRIAQLTELRSEQFDFSRLQALLHELNSSSKNRNYLSIAFLCRAIIDHIPPVFGYEKFAEVVNNYQSTKSFKKNMEHLHNSLRNIADGYLHVPIRKNEEVPHFVQVDFRASIDQLLGEVVRVLKMKKRI